MKYISPSAINSFYQCPFKYWAHYIAKLPEIRTPDGPALFGRAIHNMITIYYDKLKKNTPLETALEQMEETIVEGADYRVDSYKTTLKSVQRNLTKFETNRISKKKDKPKLLEKKLFTELDPSIPPIGGIVDAYFDDGTCVDWKTGKYAEMDSSLMVQGKVYQTILEANGYPVNKVLFVNLNRGVNLTLPRLTDAWLLQKITHMLNVIESGRFVPKESGLCRKWCGYVLSCNTRHKCPWGDPFS